MLPMRLSGHNHVMKIRLADGNDSESCLRLGSKVFGDAIGHKVGQAVSDIWKGIGMLGEARTHSVHAAYWVAEDSGVTELLGIVGLYSPRWIGEQNVYLGWFGVHPDHRRQGLGQLLIQHAEAEAAKLGFRSILVETSLQPAGTITFYQRVGFVAVAAVPDYWEDGSELILMRKSIAGATLDPLPV